jgi:hypothetical protein
VNVLITPLTTLFWPLDDGSIQAGTCRSGDVVYTARSLLPDIVYYVGRTVNNGAMHTVNAALQGLEFYGFYTGYFSPMGDSALLFSANCGEVRVSQ